MGLSLEAKEVTKEDETARAKKQTWWKLSGDVYWDLNSPQFYISLRPVALNQLLSKSQFSSQWPRIWKEWNPLKYVSKEEL